LPVHWRAARCRFLPRFLPRTPALQHLCPTSAYLLPLQNACCCTSLYPAGHLSSSALLLSFLSPRSSFLVSVGWVHALFTCCVRDLHAVLGAASVYSAASLKCAERPGDTPCTRYANATPWHRVALRAACTMGVAVPSANRFSLGSCIPVLIRDFTAWPVAWSPAGCCTRRFR